MKQAEKERMNQLFTLLTTTILEMGYLSSRFNRVKEEIQEILWWDRFLEYCRTGK